MIFTAVGAAYLVSATLFILALRWMSTPETARRAVASAVAAMTIAVVATLARPDVVSYQWTAAIAIH
jgi:H+-translocating NAD(P) transhydrogenase subunit beta